MKILVIEDDALLLQGLILAMQSEGYVCDGVSTAHEAALSLVPATTTAWWFSTSACRMKTVCTSWRACDGRSSASRC